jgi:predicted SprT family Zn-dependent metalloprotease
MTPPAVFRTKQTTAAPARGRRTPTKVQFAAYERMFGYFNRKLFAGSLPACLLNFSRKAKTYGFFAPQRWQSAGQEVRHEISLNPASLRSRKPIEVASTLVHEMVHLWQQDFGRPSRRGYHNAEWASKMDEVGLVPSSTAAPGGARVGQLVSHYIAQAGRFAEAFAAMPAEYLLPWSCEEPEEGRGKAPRRRNKVKYTCLGCAANVWGKPGLTIVCGDCDAPFAEEHAD